MTEEIEMRRRFESYYAEQHDLRPKDVAEYRMTDGSYRLPGIASHWRTYKRACEDALVDPSPSRMLEIGHNYWLSRNKQGFDSGAVKWVQDEESGALLIFTRGEYREELLDAVWNLEKGSTK